MFVFMYFHTKGFCSQTTGRGVSVRKGALSPQGYILECFINPGCASSEQTAIMRVQNRDYVVVSLI